MFKADVTESAGEFEPGTCHQSELSMIFDHAPLVMCLLDEEQRVVRMNRAAVQFSGRDQEDLVGQSAGEVIGCVYALASSRGCGLDPACGRCALRQAAVETLSKGVTRTRVSVTPTVLRDGVEHSVTVIASTTRLHVEGNTRVLLCLEDVTRYAEAENALKTTEARYRDLADSIKEIFFAMDRRLKYTFWNKASEALTGIPASEALGQSLFDIFPDIRGTETERFYREVLERGEPRMFTSTSTVKGVLRTFEVSASPVKEGIAVVAADVTERRRAERALTLSESRFRSLFDAMNEGTALHELVWDDVGMPKDYRVIDVNRSQSIR